MREFLLVPLIIMQLIFGIAGGAQTDAACETKLAEEFLTQLYTVSADAQLGEPSPEYEAYLEASLGAYCAPEVLDTLIAARFPFSITGQGYGIRIEEVQLEAFEQINAQAGIKVNYKVLASKELPDGATEPIEFTGRLTLAPEDGRVCAIRLDHLK